MPLVGFNPCIILKIKLRIQLDIIARLKEPSNISVTFKSMTEANKSTALQFYQFDYDLRLSYPEQDHFFFCK